MIETLDFPSNASEVHMQARAERIILMLVLKKAITLMHPQNKIELRTYLVESWIVLTNEPTIGLEEKLHQCGRDFTLSLVELLDNS